MTASAQGVVQKDPNAGRTRCKVYSRVVGFIRPVDNWNDSKATEFGHRKVFGEPGMVGCHCEELPLAA